MPHSSSLSFAPLSKSGTLRFIPCERGTPTGKRGRPLVVKRSIVLDAPRIRLRVGACRTHGYELVEYGVPHLRVSSVRYAVQDDATRATRSVHVVSGVHGFGWYTILVTVCVCESPTHPRRREHEGGPAPRENEGEIRSRIHVRTRSIGTCV